LRHSVVSALIDKCTEIIRPVHRRSQVLVLGGVLRPKGQRWGRESWEGSLSSFPTS